MVITDVFRGITEMWQNEKEDMFLAVMAVLLILLSAVIWIAFCVAVKKTASKFIELKRQRRREALIAAALNRVALGNVDERRRATLPLYIATLTQRINFLRNQTELPSYEQAISMSCTPSPNPPLAMTTQNERVSPHKPKATKVERILRIAPDRPGALPTIVLPPSYDSAVRSDLQITTPTSSTTSSIYSISSSIENTPL